MNDSLVRQTSRELLDVIRANGGQASWRALTKLECDVLLLMEQDGIIECVDAAGQPCGFNYRLKEQRQE